MRRRAGGQIEPSAQPRAPIGCRSTPATNSMPIQTCPECSGTVSTLASACPHCGAPAQMPQELPRQTNADSEQLGAETVTQAPQALPSSRARTVAVVILLLVIFLAVGWVFLSGSLSMLLSYTSESPQGDLTYDSKQLSDAYAQEKIDGWARGNGTLRVVRVVDEPQYGGAEAEVDFKGFRTSEGETLNGRGSAGFVRDTHGRWSLVQIQMRFHRWTVTE